MDVLLDELTRFTELDRPCDARSRSARREHGYPFDGVKANARDIKLDEDAFGFER